MDKEKSNVVHSDTYFIPSIIRIIDEVDNTSLSDNEKTMIVESLVDQNDDLTDHEKTMIRETIIEKTSTDVFSKNKKILTDNIKMLVRKFVFLVLLFYVLFFHIFGFTRIKDRSMSPNVAPGDLLLFYRLDHNYRVGDVVTFVKDNKRYSLRVLAIQGQMISFNEDGDFLIDGNLEYHETYLKTLIPKQSKIHYPYRVAKGKVFVVGDYRSEANDSRIFGAIDVKSIDGKVISLLQTKDI